MTLVEQANRALGRLDGITSILPAPPLFLFMYVRKEALLSSQIEGTQSSLSDLLLFENDEIPQVAIDDVQEVSNYVAAMQYGLERLGEGFPLSLRLIREIHDILLRKGAAAANSRGSFAARRTGSAARGLATPCSYPRLRMNCRLVSTILKNFYMTRERRLSSARRWLTSNLKASIHFLTVTDDWGAC